MLKNVVRRRARDEARRPRREARAAHAEGVPGAADAVAREEILRAVGVAVCDLGAPYRAVVLMRHYEGLSPRAIADRLGVPVETVKSRLKRAHEQLNRPK